MISRTNELLQAANDGKQKQENILEQRQKEIKKLEHTVQSVSAEVVKVGYILSVSSEVVKVGYILHMWKDLPYLFNRMFSFLYCFLIFKGNDIIQRLQTERRTVKSQVQSYILYNFSVTHLRIIT